MNPFHRDNNHQIWAWESQKKNNQGQTNLKGTDNAIMEILISF